MTDYTKEQIESQVEAVIAKITKALDTNYYDTLPDGATSKISVLQNNIAFIDAAKQIYADLGIDWTAADAARQRASDALA
tara:strand:+ start:8522 stop:8761 length:240 start_codon:yes stop_codon:yes gene_type:complete